MGRMNRLFHTTEWLRTQGVPHACPGRLLPYSGTGRGEETIHDV